VKIINLISGPRNISTALMYSFGQRSDTTVFDEPFYAIYLKKTGANHPGRDEVLQHQSDNEDDVRTMIAASSNPVVFVKNMAHHMEVLRQPILPDSVNLFLIRNPRQIIASYAQVIESPVMRDIGIEYQYQLFQKLKAEKKKTILVDSGLVLENPKAVLEKVCEQCEIEFQPSMLHWKSGAKQYDGVWAKHWYKNVHNSTGFEKQNTSERPLPDSLKPLYVQAYGYYEKLLPICLKA
jgi:hypothetical protein